MVEERRRNHDVWRRAGTWRIFHHRVITIGLVWASFVTLAVFSSTSVYADHYRPLQLTSEEQDFLKAHPVLRLGVGTSFPPFMFVDGDKDDPDAFKGIVIDTVKHLEQKLGVRMEPVLDIPFKEALAMGRNGEIDMFPALAITPERQEFLTYTRPYISYPLVIITRDDAPFVGSVNDLHGRTVAVIQHLANYSKFINDLPDVDMKFHFVDNVPEKLKAVSVGQADACVANLAVASYYISRMGLGNLKIASPTPWGENKLAMAVRKDIPLLEGILQKALASMTFDETDAIRQKWIGLKPAPLADPNLVRQIGIQVAITALIVFGVILLWNRRLRREVRIRQAAEKSAHERESHYRALFDLSHDAVLLTTIDGKFKDMNQAALDMFGYHRREDMDGIGPAEVSPKHQPSGLRSGDEVKRLFVEAAQRGSLSFEWCHQRQNGERFDADIRLSVIDVDAEKSCLVTVRDISNVKKADMMRADVERMVRHELRTPLNGLINTCQTLIQNPKLDPELVETVHWTQNDALRMLEIIDLQRDLYQMETGTYVPDTEEVDLLGLVTWLRDDLAHAADAKDVTINVLVNGLSVRPDQLFLVQGEEPLCGVLVSSLLSNAVEAAPRGTSVRVTLDNDTDQAVMSIHNKGAVPREIKNRFFDKYVTAGKESGTGLGTYTARIVAETFGGSVELIAGESETMVTVRLPK